MGGYIEAGQFAFIFESLGLVPFRKRRERWGSRNVRTGELLAKNIGLPEFPFPLRSGAIFDGLIKDRH
jgi:hypothetical protein